MRHPQKELAGQYVKNRALSRHEAVEGIFCGNEDGWHRYSGNIGVIKNGR
jgi:hypothetical protein